ncbi:MAG: small ribosomal subunit Rsm22 family protein [Verrucomicrobia bacterium]|jgi:hypothetical protein|nr:small ribosomal subunit Rsm22 family protein [Verrucomicrobiota bacterium]
MNWSAIDWKALERMRAAFLGGTAGHADYWQSESDLASYDATFAQRIGWKWDYVLAELQRRGWQPAPGALMDWGCGSGIAHRAFLDHFGTTTISELWLLDRSALAMRFSERRAREKYGGLKIAAAPHPVPFPIGWGESGQRLGEGNTLLISHVLTELTPEQVESLADFAASFTSVIWVEPGTYEASLTLIAVRERLRGQFNVVAPCTHQAQCGILALGNESHWCHHFATPPPEVFTDGNWAKFGELAGVDLRSLPLSFLVLDKRPVASMPSGATRVIGRPRLYKAHALVLGCEATGVTEKRLMKRHAPDFFRQLKRNECAPLQAWRCEGGDIVEAKPL